MWETCKVWLGRYNIWDDRTALRLLSALLFPRNILPETVRHIVIYRVGNIGDTVVAIPAMAALREAFPQAHITLLTSAGSADLPGAGDVLTAFPQLVNQLIAYLPAEVKSIRGLQQLKSRVLAPGPVDLWVSLPVTMQIVFRGFREVGLARWLGSRRALGFTMLLPEFFKTTYARHNALPKTSDWLLSMVQTGLNLPALEPNYLAQFKSPAPEILERWQFDPNQPLLVINAGAKLSIKRWPVDYFRQTLAQVLAQLPNLQVALLGNAAERDMNETIAASLQGTIVNLAGQLKLGETWSLLHRATAVLSNDTGTMHMAGLLHKKVFTPMSGQYAAPLGPAIQIFSHAAPCAPCFKQQCPLPQQRCLTEIQPAEVAKALCDYLISGNAELF
jgi:heptosyltransferase-1